MTASSQIAPPRPGPGGSRLEPVAFEALRGWALDDHEAALAAFLRTCPGLVADAPALRPGLPTPEALRAVCRRALAGPGPARAFFEREFQAFRIVPDEGRGFLTGYYEPEMEARTGPSPEFPVPVLGRPDDLVTFPPGETPPGLDPSLAAARRTQAGLEPFPDRAAIQDGALAGRGLALFYVRDEVELFLAQVQGSARVRLADGRVERLVYAGRNGHPYTSIGRVIVAEGHMALEDMTLDRLKAWLRAHPAEARRIMRLNRSYIFFARGEGMDPAHGPIGAASAPLSPLRSIAVDRNLWPYGLPFFVSVALPVTLGVTEPFQALAIAQDTGSAILGPARADLFIGSGEAAGARAGLVRQAMDLTVLLPRETTP
ncbi:MltA domain-containing protein [Alsobacter sp. SYSU M60028]|uniref:peptidoglycan lytic exotransglycosylase n=1 Tax=Alsobacter ponti TaxID=2962936 RepID=A0ABT1LCH9_9HYPH|nr:MltA domain-containing protein [Alsobacter ponti]